MKPTEYKPRYKTESIEPAIATRLYNWHLKVNKTEPDESIYCSFGRSIRNAKKLPARPKADERKRQLLKFSDALSSMDEYVMREIIKEISPLFKSEGYKVTKSGIETINYKLPSGAVKTSPVSSTPILLKYFWESAANISFDLADKKMERRRLARDKAVKITKHFLYNYQKYAPGKNPGTAQTSPFVELLRIALDAVGYPIDDPTRLVKDCINSL